MRKILAQLSDRPQQVPSFLRFYAEEVPPDYKISRLEYRGKEGFKLSIVSSLGVGKLLEALSSKGTAEVLSYKKVGDEVYVELLFKPRGW